MKKKFNVLIEKGEDGYLIASVPSLPGCHTQAKDFGELNRRIKEAIEVYLDVVGDKDIQQSEFVGVQVVEAETN